MATDPLGKESNRSLPVRLVHWLSGEYGAPERQPRGKSFVATRSVMVLACVLPIVSFVTCEEANRPSAEEGSVAVSLSLFGASVLVGFVALMLWITRARGSSGLAVLFNLLGVGANVYYFVSNFSYTRGRQIRTPTGRVLPWRASRRSEPERRARAAGAWRNNADTEAASVSAFSLLSLDLAALGAPLELVRGAHEAALEEVEHAERCYALARHFGDLAAAVAPMPSLREARVKPCTHASVAVESWVEGAYLETVSAEIARELEASVTDDAVRDVLKLIARDEARHAAHAWAVVEWCLSEDAVRVRSALASVAKAMNEPDPSGDESGSDGSLEFVGIPGRTLQRSIATRCLAEAKQRLLACLGG